MAVPHTHECKRISSALILPYMHTNSYFDPQCWCHSHGAIPYKLNGKWNWDLWIDNTISAWVNIHCLWACRVTKWNILTRHVCRVCFIFSTPLILHSCVYVPQVRHLSTKCKVVWISWQNMIDAHMIKRRNLIIKLCYRQSWWTAHLSYKLIQNIKWHCV